MTAGVWLIRQSFDILEKYQIILNKANQNRDLSEQMVTHANQILANRAQAKALLGDDIARFQLNLDVLKLGGVESVNGRDVVLPPCEPQTRAKLEEIEKIWDEVKTKAEYLVTYTNINPEAKTQLKLTDAQEYVRFMEQKRELLIVLQGQFINNYQDITDEKKNTANAWLWGIWIVNVLWLLIGFLILHALILSPLHQIQRISRQINEGDLSQKIAYHPQNEVGSVASALNGMVDKIRNATEFIRSIEKGDLSVSYTGINGSGTDKDMLAGALLNMREKMKNVAVEEEERNWATKGQATFGEILQKFNDDTETLSYEIISNLVKYLDANQGGLFIVDETTKNLQLNLIAAYAFNRRRYQEKRIALGEGLVGQAFKDADTIYITDIPENYVDITSGLGGAQPKSVLVVPLKLSDRVYGVMELASFYEFKDFQIKFLEKLSENIASNLYAARANEQTKKLLAESNLITERLRKQEQETRRNLQILENTQAEMQKNQEALAGQSYAIRSTLITVELGLDRKIQTVNDLFLQATKYTPEEVLGKEHNILIPDNQVDTASNERLWRDLRAGIPRSGEFKRVDKYGQEIWLRATYSPIKDKNGIPYKVLKLAFDITEDKKTRLDFKEQLDAFRRSSGILEFDITGKIIDANENFLELMEYSREEVIGKDHTIIVPDEEKNSRAYLALWHKLRQGTYHIGEVKRITKSGRTVWFQGSFNPILDLDGNPYKIIEVIINVTDRKLAEVRMLATKEELQSKESNLVALINNTDDAIYTVNTNYRVTLLNESTRKLYEKVGGTVRISTNILDCVPKTYYYIWKAYYDRTLGGEKFSIEQAIFSEETGQKIYLSVYFNPIWGEQGQVTGVAIFARDISARKQRELDIAEFAQKQANRTARIIENQKQTLLNVTKQYEEEQKQLSMQIEQLNAEIAKNQKYLRFLTRLDVVAICINQNYEIVQMNEVAQATYRHWHLYLQPDYFLPDTFAQNKYEVFKNYLDKAFDGERLQFFQLFPNHKTHQSHWYNITLEPLKNDLQQVTHLIISAKAADEPVLNYRAKELKNKQQKLINFQKTVKNLQKDFDKSQQTWQADRQKLERKNQQQMRQLDLLNQTSEVILSIDYEMYVSQYNPRAWQVFHSWRYYIQPEYFLPDTFPMAKYHQWEKYLQRALKGEEFKIKEVFVNRILRKFSVFEIGFYPQVDSNNLITHVLIKANDVSEYIHWKTWKNEQKQKI
ncbi:MAG: PAS domain S-box protein [Microscillaceae bacterium]|nr:PAS domain S-box protein [Microscillaceae bacterium]